MAFDKTLGNRLAGLQIRAGDLDRWYLGSYQLFIDYFRTHISSSRPSRDACAIAVTLVYSWMGRGELDPNSWSNFDRFEAALPRCYTGTPTQADIEDIRSFVGGSVIATSKFLHFLEPDRYAMWDQYVALSTYRYRRYYQYNDVKRYLTYLRDVRALKLPADVRSQVREVVGKGPSYLRVKEFALFHLGIAESKE